MKQKCIPFLLFFLVHHFCIGQPHKYRFRVINLPENFKNQYISQVDEYASGILWFVTISGLHRYDGNHVLTFDMESTPALPNADISHIVADGHNILWIATRNNLRLRGFLNTICPAKPGPNFLSQEPIITPMQISAACDLRTNRYGLAR